MFGDVIEAEKAAQNDEGARDAVVPDTLLDPEGAVEDASVDVRDLEGGAGDEAFARDSGGDQASDQAVSGHPVALVDLGVLPAGEDAGVVADEREPGGVGGRETEFAEGLLTAGEMGDLQGLPHGSEGDGPVNLEAGGEERSNGLTGSGAGGSSGEVTAARSSVCGVGSPRSTRGCVRSPERHRVPSPAPRLWSWSGPMD